MCSSKVNARFTKLLITLWCTLYSKKLPFYANELKGAERENCSFLPAPRYILPNWESFLSLKEGQYIEFPSSFESRSKNARYFCRKKSRSLQCTIDVIIWLKLACFCMKWNLFIIENDVVKCIILSGKIKMKFLTFYEFLLRQGNWTASWPDQNKTKIVR